MQARETNLGITGTGSPHTVATYLQRVSGYIDQAIYDIVNIRDAAYMATGDVSTETAAEIRAAINTARTLTHALASVSGDLLTILDSVSGHGGHDPSRAALYQQATERAKSISKLTTAHIRALDAVRASVHAGVTHQAGGVSSAALAATAKADDANSHILLACYATRQLLIDMGELEVYKPKL